MPPDTTDIGNTAAIPASRERGSAWMVASHAAAILILIAAAPVCSPAALSRLVNALS